MFYENYLGKKDATFTLNSTGSSMVLAQYYNFVRFGHDGYRFPIMETMQANTRELARRMRIERLRIIGSEGEEQLPLVAFQLDGEHNYDEFDVASQLAAERGWMVPAYTLPQADHIKIMRALVKLTLGYHPGRHPGRRHGRGLQGPQWPRRAACTSTTAVGPRPAPRY